MDKETFEYVAKRADILEAAGSSTQVTKDAAAAWKKAVAADNSDAAVEAATKELLDILEGRPTTIAQHLFCQGSLKGDAGRGGRF